MDYGIFSTIVMYGGAFASVCLVIVALVMIISSIPITRDKNRCKCGSNYISHYPKSRKFQLGTICSSCRNPTAVYDLED